MKSTFNRRAFLQRTAIALPAFHALPILAMPSDDPHASSTPAPARFAKLQLQTATPLADMARFYREALRLEVKETRELLRIVGGETVIEFSAVAPRESGATNPYYHFAFNIPHNQLDSAKAWLEPRCPLVKLGNGEVIANFQNWDAHAFYFLDPAGNILEFIARHTLKNDREGGFNEKNILCASEIGVVSPEVVAAADKLCDGAGLTRYRSGSPEFTAVGDEQGLFIVVKTGRRWFSSDRAAEVFEANAHLRGEVKTISLAESSFAVHAKGR